MSDERTVTVRDTFFRRDRQMTEEDFVEAWVSHARQVYKLDFSSEEWRDFCQSAEDRIAAKARSEWLALWEEQTGGHENG